MRLVTPERWYVAFWIACPVVFVALSILLARLFLINPLVQELRLTRVELAALKGDAVRAVKELTR